MEYMDYTDKCHKYISVYMAPTDLDKCSGTGRRQEGQGPKMDPLNQVKNPKKSKATALFKPKPNSSQDE